MVILVNTLNESGDIYTFIRDVRLAYKTLVSIRVSEASIIIPYFFPLVLITV